MTGRGIPGRGVTGRDVTVPEAIALDIIAPVPTGREVPASSPADGRTSFEQAHFDDEVRIHDRAERRLLWKEVTVIVFVIAVVIVRHLWLT